MQSMALMAAESSLMSALRWSLPARAATREESVATVVIVVIAAIAVTAHAVAEMAPETAAEESQEEREAEDHPQATSASIVATPVIGKQNTKFG